MSVNKPGLRFFGVAVAFALPFAWAGDGWAQETCGEQTCPKGFTCESGPAPCPDIGCLEGECLPCEGETQYCAPANCQNDSECADDMLCALFEYRRCDTGADPACREGEDCSTEFAPTNCQIETLRQCAPRWQLPCEAASDCGAGFTCEERQSCGTPGSPGQGSLPDSGGAEPAPPAEMSAVTCMSTGEFACIAIQVACTSDAQCTDGWTCRDNPEGACSSGSVPSAAAGSTPAANCTVPDPAQLCMPPYSDIKGRPGGGETSGRGDSGSLPGGQSGGERSGARGSSGCSVAPLPAAGESLAFLALGLCAAGLSARRRRNGTAS